MAKILKNTTGSDIDIKSMGVMIPASGQIELNTTEYPLLSEQDTVTELTSSITSGDIVVNDGTGDLSPTKGINYIKYTDEAKSVRYDNSVTNFSSNPVMVQDAIESLRNFKSKSVQFQYLGSMNSNQYLFSHTHQYWLLDRRSGDSSNGYRYQDSSPILMPYSGKVIGAHCAVTSVAVSTGSKASTVNLKFELWKVGFSSQGTKIGDIIFGISSGSYTIGIYWNTSGLTAYKGDKTLDLTLSQGDMLALKFVQGFSSSSVVSVVNPLVSLRIESV